MKEYIKVSLVLCLFGFLREFRPSESFVTNFLTSPEWRNVTEEELNRLVSLKSQNQLDLSHFCNIFSWNFLLFQVYPVGTYSYLALLIVVFLITDILR